MDLSQLGTIGMIGGILGSALGIAGGLLGCCIPYRLAKTPRQRSFILTTAAFYWVLVLGLLAALLLIPSPWKYLVWIPYIVILLGSIFWFNRRHKLLLNEETAAKPSA